MTISATDYFKKKYLKKYSRIIYNKNMEQVNIKARERYRLFKESGLCAGCGKVEPVVGRVRCFKCLEQQAHYIKHKKVNNSQKKYPK